MLMFASSQNTDIPVITKEHNHTNVKICQQCQQSFDMSSGEDYVRMCRQLLHKQGNINLCYNCDPPYQQWRN